MNAVHACRRPDFLFVQKVSKDTPEGGKIPNLSPPSGLPPHSNGSRSVLLDNSPCELERLFPTKEPSVSCCLTPTVSPLWRTLCAAAGGLDPSFSFRFLPRGIYTGPVLSPLHKPTYQITVLPLPDKRQKKRFIHRSAAAVCSPLRICKNSARTAY